jgi:hypothetical protein
MSNPVEKDIIGEHEGFLSNPFIAFFLALVMICLFAILGGVFHKSKRAQSADSQARDQRFQTLNSWKSENPVNLESYKILANPNSSTTVYQIPLSEAKKLVLKEYSQAK